jgi:hypothetical protein
VCNININNNNNNNNQKTNLTSAPQQLGNVPRFTNLFVFTNLEKEMEKGRFSKRRISFEKNE